jgi:signal peptidase
MIKKILNVVYGILLALLVALAVMLAASILPIPGNYRVLSVLSGSMEPAIHTGSVVIVAPAEDYKIGEVITFGEISKTKTPTTHRINDIKVVNDKPVYITKGDANNAPDNKEVAASEVKGKVLFSIPYLGFALNFVKQPIGFALVIIVPAILIIWEEAKKIFHEITRGKKKAAVVEIDEKQDDKNV